jgi:uncharacterized protein (DUF2141 family)
MNLRISPLLRRLLLAGGVVSLTGVAALAADLVVTVNGVTERRGEIGVSLYATPEGFPTDNARAIQLWLPANNDSVTFRFPDLAPGRYAVAASHDLNGNRKVDTNFLGIPKEAWGVSNNPRPALRAPRFDEAVFTIPAGAASAEITITVKR